MVKIIEPIFEETRTVGNIAKELVRALLEGAGYAVFPFGYESYFTHIKDLIHKGKLKKKDITDQLASMPDLVVVDEEVGDISLVEVKYRKRHPTEVSLNTKMIEKYIKFWPNSILVVVVPFDSVFYAKEMNKIKEEVSKNKIELAKSDKDIPDLSEILQIADISFSENDLLEHLFPRISNFPDKKERLQNLAKRVFKDIDVGPRGE